jgi:ribosome-associated protein
LTDSTDLTGDPPTADTAQVEAAPKRGRRTPAAAADAAPVVAAPKRTKRASILVSVEPIPIAAAPRRAKRAPATAVTDAVLVGAAPKRARRAGLPARNEPAPDRQPGDEGARLALELARRVVDLATDKKAADIVLIAVGELTTLADYLVICSGGSERQLGAIADGIAQGLKDEGITAIGREGESTAHWVLIDYGSVIVHIFAQPERDFYQLEKLWSDAPMLLRVQ